MVPATKSGPKKRDGVGNLPIPNAISVKQVQSCGFPRNAYRRPDAIPIAPRIMPTATAARGERIVRP